MRNASKLVVALMIASSVAVAGPGADVAGAATRVVPSFADLDCPSPTSCFAVGFKVGNNSHSTSLVEHWNGAKWSIVPSPSTNGGALYDVACPTTKLCLAVGGTGFSTSKAFALRWNGTKWSTVPSPSPAGSVKTNLASVSCASPKLCVAVGSSDRNHGSVIGPLIEQWNGTRWSIVKSPKLPSGHDFELYGVSCPTAKRCFAVGGSQYDDIPGAAIASWSGAAWSAADGPTTFGPYTGVTCTSASSCFAVGAELGPSADMKTVVEGWNGSSWTRVPSPNRSGAYENELADVTCTGPKNCLAVGLYSLAHPSPLFTLALHWNGTKWSLTTTPNPHPSNNALEGVACAKPALCFAGGFSSANKNLAPIERWNGKAWTYAAHPTPTS